MHYKVLKGDIWTAGPAGGADVRHTTGQAITLDPASPDTKALLRDGKIVSLEAFKAQQQDADPEATPTDDDDKATPKRGKSK